LTSVLQRLVEASHTIFTIEHNLDVLKSVDGLIELGPEGGAAGGERIAEGTPVLSLFFFHFGVFGH
jgi:excinuclease ABC subunit A